MMDIIDFLKACGLAVGILLLLWAVFEARGGMWLALVGSGILALVAAALLSVGLI
jgi:hypothetical protein